jgi:hypothetical protein
MGGRRFGKAMMIMFAFGAGTHADSAVGVTASPTSTASRHLVPVGDGLHHADLLAAGADFPPRRVLTTADFFQRRFGTEMMYVYSLFRLFVMLSFNGVMFYGSAKVIEALTGGAIHLHWAIVMMAVVSFLYGIFGGLIAAVWNDFFQGSSRSSCRC